MTMYANVSKPLAKFFGVEIRNGKFGGDEPATISSAWDSWQQAPSSVRAEWCGVPESALSDIHNRLKKMVELVPDLNLEDVPV